MRTFANIFDTFFAFKRVPIRVIILTALMSYALQLGTIIMGQPVYIIIISTILPWIPVLWFESMWKVKHYHWVAVLGVLAILQAGHLVDYVTQASIVAFANGTPVCPAPIDDEANFGLAVDEGLRTPHQLPTGAAASQIVVPTRDGGITVDADGQYIAGPPACGIFGQLELPILSLLWDLILWIFVLMLLQRFPKNAWLWFAMVVASISAAEHMFTTYSYYFANTDAIYAGTEQLWGTLLQGTTVLAVPVGKEPILATFYEVAGQYGIFAQNGFLSVLAPSMNEYLPSRLWQEFLYNTLIAFPLLIAFVWEMRRIYDFYLAEALPNLSRDQLVAATPRLERETFHKGDVIIKQGDIADTFYIISSGEVEIIFEDADAGTEDFLDTLGPGQYFGEVGLMQRSPRMATVRAHSDVVEVMALDHHIFGHLMENSEISKQEIKRVTQQRLAGIREADAT